MPRHYLFTVGFASEKKNQTVLDLSTMFNFWLSGHYNGVHLWWGQLPYFNRPIPWPQVFWKPVFRGKQGHTDLSALISHFVGVHFSRKWASTSSSNFQIECPSSLIWNHLAAPLSVRWSPWSVAEAQAGSVGYSSMRVNDNPRPPSSFYSTRLSLG